jgi:hypothetical protein
MRMPHLFQNLPRETHAALEIGKARIGVKTIPSWFHAEPLHLKRALLVRLFQPEKRLILIAESRINEGHAGGRHIFLRGKLFEFLEQSQRLTLLT